MVNLPVKFYTNSMEGAPQLTDDWGSLVTMLDACLVTGFNLKAVNQLTSVGGIATAQVGTGHLYRADQVLAMAGADQAEYNGEVRLLSTTSNSFTYAITGTPVSPATGASISSKVAPLGFEIAFTGTNKRVYRSTNVLSNRPYLRVDNSLDPLYTTTYAKKGKVTMAQGMSDIDTVVGLQAPFNPNAPTKNTIATGSGTNVIDGWYKWYHAKQGSNTADSVAPGVLNRNWVLVGDDRGFYLFPEATNGQGRAGYCFTDFASFRQGDGFNTLLCASDAYSTAASPPNYLDADAYSSSDFANRFSRSLDFTGKVLMTDHIQIGMPVRAGFASLNTNNVQSMSGYSTSIPWPNGPDYSLLLHPTYLRQENGHLRGKMPGIMWVLNDKPLSDLATVSGLTGFPGRTFLLVDTSCGFSGSSRADARLAFDITGPWW